MIRGDNLITFHDLDMATLRLDMENSSISTLRHAIDAHLQRGGEAQALQAMEELIGRLKEKRDRLAKEHRQDASGLAELEKAKETLGQAHLQFGLLSEVMQARRVLADLTARAGKPSPEFSLDQLTRAQERLAESEKRLREARAR